MSPFCLKLKKQNQEEEEEEVTHALLCFRILLQLFVLMKQFTTNTNL